MNKIPIVITAAPIEARPGFFEARLAARVLRSATRTPFFDAARVLRGIGYPPDTIIVMRSIGSDVDRLRSTIAAAIRLTVAEDAQGRPKYRRWMAPPASAGGPPVRFLGNPGVPTLAERAP